jgi:hypothetical protein
MKTLEEFASWLDKAQKDADFRPTSFFAWERGPTSAARMAVHGAHRLNLVSSQERFRFSLCLCVSVVNGFPIF